MKNGDTPLVMCRIYNSFWKDEMCGMIHFLISVDYESDLLYVPILDLDLNFSLLEVLAKAANFGSENRHYILIIAVSLTNIRQHL
jgi:hypothetical protein